MAVAAAPSPAPPRAPMTAPRRRWARRALLWSALLLLLVVAQSLLVALTIAYESSRLQDEADNLVAAEATELRRELMQAVQTLQAPVAMAEMVRRHPALLRVERRDDKRRIVDVADAPLEARLFQHLPRADLELEAELACALARQTASPAFSRSYFVPVADGLGMEVIDLCLPLRSEGRDVGSRVATFGLARLLQTAGAAQGQPRYEFSFVEGDGTRLARSGRVRGAGVYVAERIVDLPGSTLQLRADSSDPGPRLIPNLNTALVLGLSIALFALVFLLARDVRRRADAEQALAEALAFRKAMEDSLVTGLRARDLDGAIRYVNPAFCTMVGFTPEELMFDPAPATPPYWPPEHAEQYRSRQPQRLDVRQARASESREGFETVFMRKNGERFPVLIYEAPLVDGLGQHTGWMSAVVDASAQRRIEELARQQQDRLQASARLATMGEMASLISHELNQPLTAIASYASGSLNLLADVHQRASDGGAEASDVEMTRQALLRIAEQAERAGRVIKSVHDFVRRREQHLETLRCDLLVEGVLPLVRLQARKSGARIDIDMPHPAPHVVGDRTMLEQVLLNLTRNGLQAMETETALAERVLRLAVRQTHDRWVTFTLTDRGPGISREVSARLFTPFFTTRAEGLGLGLSLCRTVIEQHGGALDFGPPADGSRGTEFRFTLATPRAPTARDVQAPPAP